MSCKLTFSSIFSASNIDQIEALDGRVLHRLENVKKAIHAGPRYGIFTGRRYQTNGNEMFPSLTLKAIILKTQKYQKQTERLVEDVIAKKGNSDRWKAGAFSVKSICDSLDAVLDSVETELNNPEPKLDFLHWVALKIHRFFGNMFFDKRYEVTLGKDAVLILRMRMEEMARVRVDYLRASLKTINESALNGDDDAQRIADLSKEIILIDEEFGFG